MDHFFTRDFMIAALAAISAAAVVFTFGFSILGRGGVSMKQRIKRVALEREKMLTLRSIKELEFDRAMGKLSEKDFEEISTRLRARAVGLMKELDERRGGGYRALIERELDSRLAARPVPAADASSAVLRCAGCGTENDADAAFCKRCGARIAAEAPQP